MAWSGAHALFLRMASGTDFFHRHRLTRRIAGGHSDPREIERLGQAGLTRPDGPLIWIAAPDTERVLALLGQLPRISEERGEKITALVSTPTSATLEICPKDTLHQLAPFENLAATQRFLRHWRPNLAVFFGKSPPPAYVIACKEIGIPRLWLDAICPPVPSAFSLRFDAEMPVFFDHVFAATEKDALAFSRHGLEPDQLGTSGEIEEEAPILAYDEEKHRLYASALAARPVWLVPGVCLADLEMLAKVHRRLLRRAHRLLMTIVPENSEDSAAIASALAQKNWDVGHEDTGRIPKAENRIFVARDQSALGIWYRLAPVTVFAATLNKDRVLPNPFEAAALGSAIVHGPHLGAQEVRFSRLSRADASLLVQSPEKLLKVMESLLAPDKPAALAGAAWGVISEGAEKSDLMIATINDLLDRSEATP